MQKFVVRISSNVDTPVVVSSKVEGKLKMMKLRFLNASAVLVLAVPLFAGCSPAYEPLDEGEIAAALEAFEPTSALMALSSRSSSEFQEAYADLEFYGPTYPSVSSTCQAVADFPRVAQYAQGGKRWKQYMPPELRGFDAIGGKHFSLQTASGENDFANVSLDIAVISYETSEEAREVASLIRDNLDACFDFPKTLTPLEGFELDVLYNAATLIESDLEVGGGGFRFEVVENSYLELSKISGLLDDSVTTENRVIDVNQYGPNLIALVATSSGKADAVLGVSAFTISEQFPEIRENLGLLVRDAAND